jgi:iron complex outermembrane receptor protein
VDDVYYAAASATVLSFNNIQQISVLKGPQGTLFGRNATGGLIQITTRDPTEQENGSVALTYGSQETAVGDGYLSGGVAPGLAADIALHVSYMGQGFGKNVHDGTDVYRNRDLALRSKWIYRPDSDTKVTLIADYSRSQDINPAYRPVYGQVQLGGYVYKGKPFDTDTNDDQNSAITQYGISLNAQRTFGGVKLVSVTAYRKYDYYALFDSDGNPAPVLTIDVKEPSQQYSQELRLESATAGRLSWVVGLFYFGYNSGFVPADVHGLALGLVPGTFGQELLTTHQNTDSYSAFGQATYKIDDLTNLTLGLRYTSEKKAISSPGGTFDGFPLSPYSASNTVDRPTWRVALDHHFGDTFMAYVSYNRGFKNGGYDPAAAAPKPFDPETLDAYEIGVKAEGFDRRLRVNAATYYYDYRGIQLNQYQAALIDIYNGSKATVKGFDLDVTAVPIPGLTLTGGLSYLDGRYGDFPISVTDVAPGGGLVQLPNQSASGKRLQNAPDWQGNFGVDYAFHIGQDTIALDATYAYVGRWFAGPDNRLSQAPYSLVNASATWSFGAAKKYRVTLWGKNLGDTVYAEQLTAELPVGNLLSVAPGRTFGVTAGINF